MQKPHPEIVCTSLSRNLNSVIGLTEKGWNLYVCGNGGMKPRHAELLASDLDTQTLIRYIDRFFMFYIQTADRLQRTSVWRDNMEGGLDYLKAVIDLRYVS